jgi:hypothetical protein
MTNTKETVSVNGIAVPTGLFINNAWVQGSGKPLPTVNPSTEEVITEVRVPPKQHPC